ncbi:hypothetical protein ABZS61_19885 [Streptomyces sp. NPDC005566]|uniref:hypothetical protein n=1 Tax=Streptomyces sp. NPDC005566 TaxID=3156886 RepID=UPI0033A091BA
MAGNPAGEHRPAIPGEFGHRRRRYASVVAEPVNEMATKALVDVARLHGDSPHH